MPSPACAGSFLNWVSPQTSCRRGLPAPVPGSTKFSFHASTENISFFGLIIFHLSYQSACSMKAKMSFVFITISPEPRDSSTHSRCSTNSSQSNVFPLRFAFLGVPFAPREQWSSCNSPGPHPPLLGCVLTSSPLPGKAPPWLRNLALWPLPVKPSAAAWSEWVAPSCSSQALEHTHLHHRTITRRRDGPRVHLLLTCLCSLRAGLSWLKCWVLGTLPRDGPTVDAMNGCWGRAQHWALAVCIQQASIDWALPVHKVPS